MPVRIVHVYANESVWRVELDGHAPRTVNTKELALTFARDLAQGAQYAEVRIHFSNGAVESEFYGEEPQHPDVHASSHEVAKAHLAIDRIRGRHPGAKDDGKRKR